MVQNKQTELFSMEDIFNDMNNFENKIDSLILSKTFNLINFNNKIQFLIKSIQQNKTNLSDVIFKIEKFVGNCWTNLKILNLVNKINDNEKGSFLLITKFILIDLNFVLINFKINSKIKINLI